MPVTDSLNDDQKKELEAHIAAEAERLAEEKLAEKALDEEGKRILKKRNDIIDAEKKRAAALEKELADTKTKAARATEIEAELTKLKEAEEARKVDEDKRRQEEEAAKKREEDSKKDVNTRFDEMSKKFEDRVAEIQRKSDEAAAKAQEEFRAELSKRDRRILDEAVRAELTKANAVDDEVVRLIDFSDVAIDNGVPDRSKIAEIVAAHKEAKPHFYTDGDTGTGARSRDAGGRFQPEPTRPKPADSTRKKVDWANLSDDEFRRMEAEFRQSNRG